MLYYVTFIDSLVVFRTKAMSFESKQFTNNSINKMIGVKINEHFVYYSKKISLPQFCCTKKYEVLFEDPSHEVLEFFSQNRKVSDNRLFMHNKFCHMKFI
jgi:hypothetical protein